MTDHINCRIPGVDDTKALDVITRLPRYRLHYLAATGRLSQDEVQAELLPPPDEGYVARWHLECSGLGPDLIDLDDSPSAFA